MSTVLFKEWLPDQPDFNNPGLIEALNVVPVGDDSSGFQPYNPLATTTPSFSSLFPLDHVAVQIAPSAGNPFIYVGTEDGHVYQMLSTGGTWTDLKGSISTGAFSIAQYNTVAMIATGQGGLYWQTAASTSTVNAITGSPKANVLGVIGQFMMAGNISTTPKLSPNLLQWSSIDNPTDWPAPGSDSALASQSGEQILHVELGTITGIFGGDQWGIVLQQNGITRVTYIGGATVFQFDTLSAGIGMDYQNLGVKIGNQVYFCSSRGVYMTDGVSIAPLGEGKVNLWFITNVVNAGRLSRGRVAVDWSRKLIVWAFIVSSATIVLIYNYETQRFSHAVDTNLGVMVSGNDSAYVTLGLQAIGQDNQLGTFTGTPGTATLISGEAELTPGAYTRISGIKPLVGATANAMVSSVGYRNDLQSSATFATDTTQNSRSGFADFRIEARYARARVKVTGAFTNAQGLEFNAIPGGSV